MAISFNEIRYFTNSKLPDMHAECKIVQLNIKYKNSINILMLKIE